MTSDLMVSAARSKTKRLLSRGEHLLSLAKSSFDMVGHAMNEIQHCRSIILGTTLFLLSINIVNAEDFPRTDEPAGVGR